MQRGVSSASIGWLRRFARFDPPILLVFLVLLVVVRGRAYIYAVCDLKIAASRCQCQAQRC
jgi:hypothetical protein